MKSFKAKLELDIEQLHMIKGAINYYENVYFGVQSEDSFFHKKQIATSIIKLISPIIEKVEKERKAYIKKVKK